jgi:TIR domain/Pentapeptide repeats (8 copies)
MANEEHVAMLKQGVDAWNEWRDQEAPGLKVNLSGADLIGANLSGANLSGADLIDANLLDSNLIHANLSEADLSGAHLSRATLIGATLSGANLSAANLSGADLSGADLIGATLSGADLIGADLSGADLIDATLIGATLSGADLINANLIGATLSGADLSGAALLHTVFGATTLTEVKGLNHCRHDGPSFIDFRTLRNSGPLPTAFLRGAGLPDNLIEYLPSLLNEAIQFYSCFISHSGKDQAFAERLHADLQSKGVRCWFAPHDMPIGAKIIDAIDEAIRLRDKVLLILSEGAIASDWVEGEVTRALEEERTRKQVVLFPVRLDNAVMQTSEGWARLLRGQRNIGDFSRWKEDDSYQNSFDRLMRDLRVENPGQ